MRHGRSKQNRKTIQFFERTVPTIKSPYNILIDGTFIVSSITYKIPIIERLIRLLQHGNTFNLYCTSSTIIELQYLKNQQQQLQQANNKNKKKVSTNNNTKRKTPDNDESEQQQQENNNNINDSVVDKCIIFQEAIDFINTNCQIIDVPTDAETETETTTIKALQEYCSTEFGIVQSSITKLSKTTIDVLNVLTQASIVQIQNKYTTSTVANNNNNNNNNNNKEQKQIAQEKAIAVSSITNDNSFNISSQEQDSTDTKEQQQQQRRLEWQVNDISTTDTNNSITNNNNKQNNYLKKHYFCACQDEDLLNIVRHITYVPIIRLARGSVLLLEQPSKYAQNAALYNEKIKWKGCTVNNTTTNTKLTTNTNNDTNNNDTTTTTIDKEQIVLDTIKQQYRQDVRIQNKEKLAKQRKVDCELYGGTSTVSEYDRRKGSRSYGKNKRKNTSSSTSSNPNPLSCKKKKVKK